jgi:hypothetical protein
VIDRDNLVRDILAKLANHPIEQSPLTVECGNRSGVRVTIRSPAHSEHRRWEARLEQFLAGRWKSVSGHLSDSLAELCEELEAWLIDKWLHLEEDEDL